jgi:prevent-host-death family protein
MTTINDHKESHMKSTTVSIAEGKKGFSRLIHDASVKKEEIIVTKRGKPVAVIVPYDEHLQSRRLEGYRMVMEGREAFLRSGLSADEIYRESRKQLEKKS